MLADEPTGALDSETSVQVMELLRQVAKDRLVVMVTHNPELAQQYGVRWLPSDFKKREGYKRSIELSKQYGLYRQEYCGCLYSKPVDNAAAME